MAGNGVFSPTNINIEKTRENSKLMKNGVKWREMAGCGVKWRDSSNSP